MRQKQNRYSDSFKLKVVMEVLEGKYTKEAARKLYGIGSNSGILEWMRIYSGYPRNTRTITKPRPEEMARTAREKELEARVKTLEAELYVAKHKAILSEKIVDVAEEQFGLELRKKFGAKLSEELKKTKK